MIREKLEEKAEKTLRETDTYRIPIAIEVLAHRLNLAIQSEALGDNVAGMLVIEGDRGAIGYNSTHVLVRQRFTIAHEISHYLLHMKKNQKSQQREKDKYSSRSALAKVR